MIKNNPQKTTKNSQNKQKKKNKKLSLYPLDFDEALKIILLIPPKKTIRKNS